MEHDDVVEEDEDSTPAQPNGYVVDLEERIRYRKQLAMRRYDKLREKEQRDSGPDYST
jgi:hypothetical protein